MFGLLKRLMGSRPAGKAAARGAGTSRGRSVTAEILANGRGAAASREAAPAAAEGDQSFDPYNTGKFDRSASWERISRTQR